MRRTVTWVVLSLLVGSCSKVSSSHAVAPTTPPSSAGPSPGESPFAWFEEALTERPERPERDDAIGPWDVRTCPGDLKVEPCSKLPPSAAESVYSLDEGITADWCNAEDRVVVRCLSEATEGPYHIRSVLHYDADGLGFRRVDEFAGDDSSPLEITLVHRLPDGARREVSLEWKDRSSAQPYSASMLLESETLVHSQALSEGVLTRERRCTKEPGVQRCTERSFEESGELYQELEFYEHPHLCLEASRQTWHGETEWVYVERGQGPLAPLLKWSRSVWGGPPGDDEQDIAMVSWTNEAKADGPPFELFVARSNPRCDGAGPSFTIGKGRLVGDQLCVETCDSIGDNCSEGQCRTLSAEERERILADAKREVERRLPPG